MVAFFAPRNDGAARAARILLAAAASKEVLGGIKERPRILKGVVGEARAA